MKKKNILITDYSEKISSKKKYIFLSKYLLSFYIKKKIKKFKVYNQDYILNSNKVVEKNFSFIFKKVNIYRDQLIKKLNFYHKKKNSKEYWGLILDPWLFLVISLIKIRYDTIVNSKIIYKDFFFKKKILNNVYSDTQNLLENVLFEKNVNNYIFNNIINFLRSNKKLSINKKINSPQRILFDNYSKNFLYNLFFKLINFFILIYVKIYKPILVVNGYMGLKNSLLCFIKSFGKILIVPTQYLFFSVDNNNIDFLYRNKIEIKAHDKFDKIFNLMAKDLFPMSFLENFNKIYKVNNFHFLALNLSKICSAQLHFLDYLRILSAELIKNNKKLIMFQHGAYIGLRKKCLVQYIDRKYSSNHYYWNNIDGLGDNYLSRFNFKNSISKKEKTKILFLSSTIRFTSGYLHFNTLDNSNNPYLAGGYELYKNLDLAIKKEFMVKLFPGKFLYSLAEKEWNENSDGKILFVKKWKEVYGAKLIILDNISTAFYEAVRLNIPVLVFTDIKKFSLKKKYEKLFINLKKLNIIHDNPFSVANFINQKYHNIDFWWNNVTRSKEFNDLVKFTMPKNKNYVSCIVKELLKNKS